MNMKKLIYILSIIGLVGFQACSDDLETQPSNKVSGPTIFASATSAETAINGIYRLMYVSGWSTNWAAENFGQTSINLIGDLMGEDMVMYAQGSGWFYEDYRFNVHGDYTNKSGRSYAIWNYYYTLISNANYVIASQETMSGDPSAIEKVVGQAYAIRAYAYFYLIQLYQQTYEGHQTAPGVPVYTEPTAAGSAGNPRGTVEETYKQINSDIDQAIQLLKGKEQTHASHIDYYVAQGLKARINLVQHKYADAATAAAEALTKPKLQLATVDALGGNNSIATVDVMWGDEIIADQSTQYNSFFSHMDADAPKMYGARAQKCISSWLYDQIPSTDTRLAWFRGPLASEGSGSNVSYCQVKFLMADYQTRTGDLILMRAEEMVLIKAEAECHLNQFDKARATITQLGKLRNPKYDISKRTDSSAYNENTIAPVTTLMDEILLQRRIELWGEAGRIFDLQRLGLGFNRVYEGSNHTEKVATKNTKAASPLFILPLPQSEIDGNENIEASDNNEIVQ